MQNSASKPVKIPHRYRIDSGVYFSNAQNLFPYISNQSKILMNENTLIPPTLARRVWSSLYELALLFGINFVTAFVVQIFLSLLNIQLPYWGHSLVFFGVMGLYFVYCWTRAGQTLAQRTWQLKTVNMDGLIIGTSQAWMRYALSYLGVLPAFFIVWTQIHHSSATPSASSSYILATILAFLNWLALLGTAFAHPNKIALHERLSKTRTILIQK